MPGINTLRGPVRITPYKLTSSSLDPVEKILLNYPYNSEKQPSKGFGGIPKLDNIGRIEKSIVNDNIPYISARFTMDYENPEIRKRAGTTEEFNSVPNWLKYVQTYLDIISFHKDSVYALVSTTSDDQLYKFEKICFGDLCFSDRGITFRDTPDTYFVGNDMLLWLLFMLMEKRGVVNNNTIILDIEYFYSEAEHKIMYSRRSVQIMRELLTSIAEKRPILKLKIYLELSGCRYSFVLYSNGKTEIATGQTSAYDDIDDLVGRREQIILDVYNKCIPILKSEFEKYPNWETERDKFRKETEEKLKKWN